MLTAPLAKLAVTIIGNISGVRPTATAIAKKKASCQSPFVNPLMRRTIGAIISMNVIKSQLTLFTPLSKLVSTRFPITLFAKEPKYVSVLVEMTTAFALPLTIFVPMKQRFSISSGL
ncbi:Uncharacterised protein [Streptococcus pneumoniae]|nr:Uncharacterised protein [Streptococcus pneumoniae]